MHTRPKRLWRASPRSNPTTLVLVCLTGGASSLLVRPAVGLTLADKTATNAVLLECGAGHPGAEHRAQTHIPDKRAAGSRAHAQPATVASLILSDVIGDDLSVIGSGPTVADPTTFMDAWRVVEHYDIAARLPQSVCRHLRQGVRRALPEDAKTRRPRYSLASTIC